MKVIRLKAHYPIIIKPLEETIDEIEKRWSRPVDPTINLYQAEQIVRKIYKNKPILDWCEEL